MIMNAQTNQIPSICKVVQKGRDSSVIDEKAPSLEYDISNNQLIAYLSVKSNGG